MPDRQIKKLNEQHKRFASEYVKDLDGTAAAIRAGYSAASAKQIGYRLSNDPKVKALIEAKSEKVLAKIEVTAEYVLGGIKRVIDRCEQTEPVLDREGNPTGEYRFDATSCLKGQELLGKHLRLFTEKHEVKLKSELSELTDEELNEVIASPDTFLRKSDA